MKMTSLRRTTTALALATLALAPIARAQHSAMPQGMTHEEHMKQMQKEEEMKAHGKQAMGFDQDTTTHHFTLAADGGAIAVDTVATGDQATRNQIRAHLKEIAVSFKQGDFAKPLMTHSEQPPGVPVMQRLAAKMSYTYADTDRGGRVQIVTSDPEALAAVHAFLTYQITEHGTGDPVAVPGVAQPMDHAAMQGAGHGAPAPPDHMEHRFDNADEWAKSFDDPARDAWQMPARVVEALQLTTGQSVADIGAGTGYFTVRLARSPAKPKVFAVDIEKSMVEYVQKRALETGLSNIVGVLAAADRTNLPEPVDVVLIVDTYHHLPNRVAYFTALKAMLRPGARLAIVDFKKDAPDGPPAEFRFTPDQISAELAKAGFVLQTRHDFLPRQMFLVYGVKK